MSDTLKNETIANSSRSMLIKAIAISLPIIFLLFVEFLLSIFNYGNNFDLFQPYSGNSDYLVFNRDASKKYFTDPSYATTGNTEIFKKVKDKNTIRLFVLGESTTIGYPYYHNGSFHRWLQYRLTHSYPNINFEIINLSLTAVNSYTIKGFAEEIVNYEPDAILIYVGHNEYYGALGVGSTQSFGGSELVVNFILEARELRVTQLISNIYLKAKNLFSPNQPSMEKTRMERMVSEQGITYQSSLYKKGVNQFDSNMSEVIGIFDKMNIPVLVSNLVSNEKDLKPFISSETLSEDFSGNYEQGLAAMKKGDFLSAKNHLNIANDIYPNHAECNFHLGKLAIKNGKKGPAKELFTNAKELDELRFRAPDEHNTIIEKYSQLFSNTYLVDSKSIFEKNSENNIIGDELLTDHVHPNLKGYSLMSDEFYKVLKRVGVVPLANSLKEMTFDILQENMPITKVDSLAGDYRIHQLKSRWPYNDSAYIDPIVPTSLEEQLADRLAKGEIDWQTANEKLYQNYVQKNQLEKAVKILESMILEFPQDPAYYDQTMMLFGELNQISEAIFYLKKSFDLAPSFDKARYLFVMLLQIDKPKESIFYLEYAIANNKNNMQLNQIKPRVERVIILKNELEKNPSDITIMNQITESYLEMDNKEGAKKYVEVAVHTDPLNEKALFYKNQLNPRKGNGF
ncbi:MAG: hypothetical protein JXR07_10560 [Reichenbachiella sp.]